MGIFSRHRYLINRDGRYFARIVIAKPLRPFLENKSELREPLGPDRRTAIARLTTAVSALQGRVAVAERKAQIASGAPITPERYPLSADQMALWNYNERIAFDLELRNATDAYADVGIDARMIELLREGGAGRLDNQSLQTLIAERIERFRRLGNTTVVFGSPEWRTLARALCISELETLGRATERDEGDFTGKREHPELAKAVGEEEAEDSAPDQNPATPISATPPTRSTWRRPEATPV